MTKLRDLTCPVCSTELSMAVLLSDAAAQDAFNRLVAISVPLSALVMNYITLFAPPKTSLTMPKQLKLVSQLLPDLTRAAITYRGRDWAAPIQLWGAAMEEMLAARAAGNLELPLKGHGYLYAVIANKADKIEGRAEAQAEADRRRPPVQGTVEVRGETMSIGQGLETVFGAKDPALAKLDADDRNKAPMPDAARALLASLRGKKGA